MEKLLVLSCLVCLLTTLAIFLRRFLGTQSPAPVKLPPGPARLPIIGNLHNVGEKPHKSLAELASVHGPLMSLKLGQVTTIVASSAEVAKEILHKHDQLLSSRRLYLSVCVQDHHKFAMPWIPVGPKWRNLRKVCNMYLFTSQKLNSNQELRSKKVHDLLARVGRSSREGKAMDIGRVGFMTTFSAISTTVLSFDLTNESSDEVVEFVEVVRSTMEESGRPNLGDYFPLFGAMDLQGIQRQMRSNFGKMLNMFGKKIDERIKERNLKTYVSGNDMLDTLLDIVAQENHRDAFMDLDHIKHLFMVSTRAFLFLSFYIYDGTDTTSSTLEWAMAELLSNPTTLAKARDELDQTIGRNNHLQESDIIRLPYLQAIIKETFRLHPAAPMLLPRMAEADVEIRGYTVPKGAQIVINVWAIGRDSSTWNNPNSFMPERFMGSEIDVRGSGCELIPFGGGRRICPGLPLAMRMLHMMLGSLIHWFEWKIADKDGVESECLDMEEKLGMGGLQKAKPLLAIPKPR
ncbi:Geraniol 8-hydroxylase [Linum perenne]